MMTQVKWYTITSKAGNKYMLGTTDVLHSNPTAVACLSTNELTAEAHLRAAEAWAVQQGTPMKAYLSKAAKSKANAARKAVGAAAVAINQRNKAIALAQKAGLSVDELFGEPVGGGANG